MAKQGHQILAADVRYGMDMIAVEEGRSCPHNDVICTTARGKPVRPKTGGQKLYIEAMRAHDMFLL